MLLLPFYKFIRYNTVRRDVGGGFRTGRGTCIPVAAKVYKHPGISRTKESNNI